MCVADFQLLRVLGRGAFGKVFLVRRHVNNQLFAMKVLNKKEVVARKVVEDTRRERQVLELITHPFIVSLRAAFQSQTKLYLVLDYVAGGELFTRLNLKIFSEAEGAFCR
jgi:serine/threonine protein kinase